MYFYLVLVAEYKGTNVSVFFYYGQSSITGMPLFAHVDQLKWGMPLFGNVCAFIQSYVSIGCHN